MRSKLARLREAWRQTPPERVRLGMPQGREKHLAGFGMPNACHWLLVASSALCACISAEADPCVGATSAALIDGAQVPVTLELTAQQAQSIVALDGAGGERRCTGMLISPAWVLSAGHCAAAAPIGSTIDVSAGDSCTTTLRAVDAVQRHSSLDLLLIHLDQPVPDSVASPLVVNLDASILDDRLDGPVELAGFGLTEDDTFARRFVAADVVKLSDTTVTVDALDDSGACLGDSGGALLQECAPSRPCVLGVLSRGSASCRGIDEYVRTDAASAWIAATLLDGH